MSTIGPGYFRIICGLVLALQSSGQPDSFAWKLVWYSLGLTLFIAGLDARYKRHP